MTPPQAPAVGKSPNAAHVPAAVSSCLKTIKKRADFLAASRAKYRATKSLILQARKRDPKETRDASIRIGITCSKKVGNAVARNRAKRRLRAVSREVMPVQGHAGWDYVLIGRAGITADRPYIDMVSDLTYALSMIHGKAK